MNYYFCWDKDMWLELRIIKLVWPPVTQQSSLVLNGVHAIRLTVQWRSEATVLWFGSPNGLWFSFLLRDFFAQVKVSGVASRDFVYDYSYSIFQCISILLHYRRLTLLSLWIIPTRMSSSACSTPNLSTSCKECRKLFAYSLFYFSISFSLCSLCVQGNKAVMTQRQIFYAP